MNPIRFSEGIRVNIAVRWLAVVVALLATFRCWETMIRASLSGSEASAALVAFPVSAYLFWKRRSAIEFRGNGNLAGVFLAMVGMLLLIGGTALDARLMAQVGSVALCFGVFASLLSPRGFRELLPVAFTLLFVVEIPGFFSRHVSLPLAKLNASLAAYSIQQLGCAVELQGTIVTTDHAQLQVVDACDGLRFFWVVLLISIAMCVTQRVSLKSSLLVLATTPLIALALNTVRISSVAIMFQKLPHESAEQYHDLSAWFMMAGACVIPSVLLQFLPVERTQSPSWQTNVPFGLSFWHRPVAATNWLRLALPIATVIGVACLENRDSQPLPVAWVDHVLQNVSYRLDHFVAEDVGIPERQLAVLRPDSSLSRRYRSLNDDRDFLMIVSFHSDGSAHAGHSVQSCYGALGWTIEELRGTARVIASSHVQRFRLTRQRSDRKSGHSGFEALIVHNLVAGAGAPTAVRSAANHRADLLRLQLVFHPEIDDRVRQRITELALQELAAPLSRLGITGSELNAPHETEWDSLMQSDSVCGGDSQNVSDLFQFETKQLVYGG